MSVAGDRSISAKTQQDLPLITVIVPIYNTGPYLRRCLTSIANQTHTNLQVICVDDGSTDNSCKICTEFTERDSRFSYVYQENSGQSAARNEGVRHALGDYIAFIDSDDYWKPMILQKLLATMRQHSAQFVMCQVWHEGFANWIDPVLDWDLHKCTGDEMVSNVLLSQNGFTASANHALFEASVVRNSKFLEGHIFEDLEYLVQIALKIDCAVAIPDRLYCYFWREGNSATRPIDLRVNDMHAVTASLQGMISANCPGRLIELDQRFISNMLWLARDALSVKSPLFEDIRSAILDKEFIGSMQSKSNRVFYAAIVNGRLTFAISCKLYTAFKIGKTKLIGLKKRYYEIRKR